MTPLTRRQFLAGVGIGGVAAAAVALVRPWGRGAGPAPEAASTTAATTPTPTAARAASPTTSTTSTAPTTSSSTTTTTAPATTTSSTPAATTSTPSTSLAPPPAEARIVEVIGREAWGAAGQRGDLPRHTIDRITVHHTAGLLADNREAPGRVRGYQRFHQDSGFVDLAYHVLIDGNGNVYEARDPAIPGETFTDYDPTGHFLPVLDGNFDEQPVPAAQLDALADVLAWAVVEYGVGADTIAGHRDYAATSCPGDSLYPLVADGTLARLAEERLATGGARLVLLPPDAAVARVAAVEAGEA